MQATVNISRALSVVGWMSEEELLWLAEQAQKYDKIVEFGSFYGRSTRGMADNSKGTIWAVDPWNGEYPMENGDALKTVNTYVMPHFLVNLEEHIKTGRVVPTRGFSYSFNLPFQVDMVFIDGDHRYNTVIKDIAKAKELVREGGIISGHDYGHPLWTGVKKAVDETFGPIEVVDSIWWTKKF